MGLVKHLFMLEWLLECRLHSYVTKLSHKSLASRL